ncbi:MAG: FixG Ig-like domain-containing protein, partial [Fimbriimonas sp.]
MPLNLSVSTDSVTVEPGQAAPLAILVENDSTTEDTVEIGILGLDGEWVIIPVSQIELRPNDKQEVKVFFKPPRSSESSAGSFPFVVKVRSLTNSDQRTSGGMLTIKPFHSLSVELNPRRGVITSTKQNNVFTATIMNMGNSEHDVQLSADDPEEACTYDFDDEQVTLRPGQQMDVDFAVTPKKKSPLGSSRLVGFIVTARSTSV